VGKGKLSYFKTPFHWILLVVPLAVLVSAIVGPDKYGALMGWGVQVSSSFATFLYLAFFAFLAMNVWKDEKDVLWAVVAFLCTSFIAVLFGILQVMQIYVFPFLSFTRTNAFNSVGTANALGIVAGAGLLLSLGMVFAFSKANALKVRAPLIVASIVFFCYILLLGFKPIWYALAPSALVVLLLGYISKEKVRLQLLLWWVGLIVVSVLFSFVSFTLWSKAAVPTEVALNQKTTWNITNASLQNGKLLLGTGPGTFAYEFLKHKPLSLNSTIFWNARFGKGASEFLSQFTMGGVLTVVAVIALMAFALYLALRKTLGLDGAAGIEEKPYDERMFRSSVIAATIFLFISYFLYPFSIVLWFSVFLMLVLLVVISRQGGEENSENLKREVDLETSPKISIVMAFVFLVGIIFNVAAVYAVVRRYAAEVSYSKALASTNIQQVETLFKEAADLNPYFDFYWRDLSAFSYNRFSEFAVQNSKTPTSEAQEQTRHYLDQALSAASRAVAVNPDNSYTWSLRGSIYEDLFNKTILRNAGVAFQDADRLAMESLNGAIARDPSNPSLYTELGKIYQFQLSAVLTNPQVPVDQKRGLAEMAVAQYDKAISLKGDYAPALFQSAAVLDLLGDPENKKKAISRLETNQAIQPNDIGIAFQLGVLYYKTKQFQKALAEFEHALSLDSNFANARYFAGILYDFYGDRHTATDYFQKIEQLNPDNQVVETILTNLRASKPALGRDAVVGVDFLPKAQTQTEEFPISESPTKIPGER